MQGFIGATLLQQVERSGGSVPDSDGSDEDLAQAPTLGGGAQWKLGGKRFDFGFEGMFGFSWRSNGTAFATLPGGGVAVAVDVDMTLFEIYGGPFVSLFLGDKMRAYFAAGPTMQWARYDQSGPSGSNVDGTGSGFGTGLYTRTGLELRLGSGTMVGIGVRWIDSSIDLDGGMGDLDLQGYQVALTVSQGI